ncbi:MAG TPA: terminase small subunit [Methylovirgula sp.]|jgi:phage terminase small subunit
MPRKLTERQQRFVEAYLVTRNASQAARDAGYSPDNARSWGPTLLRRPHIVAALRERGLDPPHGIHPATQTRKELVRQPRGAINPLEERFALAYLVTGSATEAARRVGLKGAEAHAHKSGYKMLQRPRVAAFIEAERAASIERTRVDVDRVKREFARIAFSDIGDLIEWDGNGFALKPSAEISPDDRAAIELLTVKPGENGLKATIKLHSKQQALDSLARLLGLYRRSRFVTIDQAAEKIDQEEAEKKEANAILRERLMRIVRAGAKDGSDKKA